MSRPKPIMQEFDDATTLSTGYAIGSLKFLSTADKLMEATIADAGDIEAKIESAFVKIAADLEEDINESETGSDQLKFLEIQQTILASFKNKLLERKLARNTENLPADHSFYDHLKAAYKEQLSNQIFDNLRPITLRVMSELSDIPFDDLNAVKPGDIVFATALTLKQAGDLFAKKVGGIITCDDPADGHLRAMALQHGIPCITGLERNKFVVSENDEHEAIIDAQNGRLIINPDSKTIKYYRENIQELKERRKAQEETILEPCETSDGTLISLLANVNDLDFNAVKSFPVDGIGLVRLEMIFAHHANPIGSQDQTRMFNDAFRALGPDRPVTVRLLDVNNHDKHPDQILHGNQRDNANAKGEAEGMEFLLANETLLLGQMRALVETSAEHEVKILAPAIRNLDQITRVKRLLKDVHSDVIEDSDAPLVPKVPQLGVMIETAEIVDSPATLRKAIQKSDFVSVGTNDLSHEMACTNRYGDQSLKSQAIEFNPRFIKTLRDISEICQSEGKECCMCGNLASDLNFLPLVIALEMKPVVLTEQIYDVKERIKFLDIKECKALLARVVEMHTKGEIENEIAAFNARIDQIAMKRSASPKTRP
jgi:phosphotransferase system enzyme I (PtsI)